LQVRFTLEIEEFLAALLAGALSSGVVMSESSRRFEMERAVRSRRKVYGQVLKHARRKPHQECCGILAGQKGVITQAFPANNVAADPVRNYAIASREIARLMGKLRERRLEFLGIYHSHPNWMEANEPSPTDIALACHSEAVYFIVTPRPYATTPVRAFSIRDGQAIELEIQVLP
jgi:proteasome lid subunit RPN8/RPN11